MAFDKNTVYILDTYGLIYRCYYAFMYNPILNESGENVSAIFGFFKSLAQIFKHYKPDYLIAALDSKTKTFRHLMYEPYKATRPKTPDELINQIDKIEQILNALNVPCVRSDGFEADDVIATIANRCKQAQRNCRILSGDKDLMQLVDDTTQILKPAKATTNAGSGWEIINAEGVNAEWGVYPDKLLDLLSLMGDKADNVPGCPGIGIKTGVKLIMEYGGIDGILQNVQNIGGSNGKKIAEGKDSTLLSRTLITLKNDVPLPQEYLNLQKTQAFNFNFSKAKDFFKENRMPSVSKTYFELEQLYASKQLNDQNDKDQNVSEQNDNSDDGIDLVPLKKNEGNYKAIADIKELEVFITLALKSQIIAYDSETDGLDTENAKILGFSLCCQSGSAVYVPLSTSNDLFDQDKISRSEAFSQLERIFNNPQMQVILHNAKFDYKVLLSNGFKFTTPDQTPSCRIHDTMLMAWLINPELTGKSPYSLEKLCETNLHLVGIEFSDIVEKGQTFESVPLDQATDYAAEDADFTFSLFNVLYPKLAENPKLLDIYNNIEIPLLFVLSKMERTGLNLSCKELEEYGEQLSKELIQIEKEIFKLVGHEFNISSTKQLQVVLFEERGLKTSKKTKTGYSTDTSVLEELQNEDAVAKLVLQYRELSKLLSTYVQALPKLVDKSSRIHTSFIQTGTATGRLSCREPNLQNIPVRNEQGRKIRSAFTASENTVLISADYSQIELVVLAHLSKDPNMTQAFNSGVDIHKATASLVFNLPAEQITPQMRRTAKTINFGVIYGMSAFRLAKDLDISRTQAKEFIDQYFITYKNVTDFINTTIENARSKGYVETMLGRRRLIRSINSKNKLEREASERIAINTPVQGTAADIVKMAMLNIDKALTQSNSPAKLLLQVHDELILECPDNPQDIENTICLVKEKMENVVKLNVPLKVSIEYGKNWGEFH